QTPEQYDALAPDGAEIRTLIQMSGGGLAHRTLPPEQTSQAHAYQMVDEIWYVIEGQGEVWRKEGKREEVVAVSPGTCLSIPTGTHFQFRSAGPQPLRLIVATIPPWPGPQEAVRVRDYWPNDP
ncbi:MAG: cupin domain-containing protein, partial [Chloroflexales bacterium]|nr:cupin domain-containing protein [Chloroflexales bacterium]